MLSLSDLTDRLRSRPELMEKMGLEWFEPSKLLFIEDVPIDFNQDDYFGSATFVVRGLKVLGFRDFGAFGPSTLVELIGSEEVETEGEPKFVCRRIICPQSDTCHTSAEGFGDTRAQAVAGALCAVFAPLPVAEGDVQ